ncbi:MAG: STAS domain-containing protein [Ilumatobacteraceae bacterium]
MPDERMQVVEDVSGEIVVSGEIDAHGIDTLSAALAGGAADVDTVRVDLSGVTFMDSSGLRVLVEANQRVDSGGPKLVLRAPSRQILRLLELAGLTDSFEIED